MQKKGLVIRTTLGVLLANFSLIAYADDSANNTSANNTLPPTVILLPEAPDNKKEPESESESESDKSTALSKIHPAENKKESVSKENEPKDEACSTPQQCPAHPDIETTIETLESELPQKLNNTLFNWSDSRSAETRATFTERAIKALSIYSVDQVLTTFIHQLSVQFGRTVKSRSDFTDRNYNLFRYLAMLHIYLNPTAGLQLPDFGLGQMLPSTIKNKLAIAPSSFSPALALETVKQAEVIETQLLKLLEEETDIQQRLKNVLLKLAEESSRIPDLEENGYMYSRNLMLIAVTNDLYLYQQSNMTHLGKALMNIVRSYDYMVCLAENNTSNCKVYIVSNEHPSGQVIRKIQRASRANVPARQINEALYRLKPAIFLIHQIAGTNDAEGSSDDKTRWYIDTLK